MDSGNITVFDLETVFKRILVEQEIESRKLASCSSEDVTSTHTAAKVSKL